MLEILRKVALILEKISLEDNNVQDQIIAARNLVVQLCELREDIESSFPETYQRLNISDAMELLLRNKEDIMTVTGKGALLILVSGEDNAKRIRKLISEV